MAATNETSGHRAFRTALLAESALNISSMIPMLFAPDLILSYIVKSPAQITPLSRSLVQWTGALVTLATVPLLLSYPNPAEGSGGAEHAAVTARRRLAYASFGITEVVLASTTAWQWLSGAESGITDSALLMATASVSGFGLLRGWFLLAKPEWMEPPSSSRKKE